MNTFFAEKMERIMFLSLLINITIEFLFKLKVESVDRE